VREIQVPLHWGSRGLSPVFSFPPTIDALPRAALFSSQFGEMLLSRQVSKGLFLGGSFPLWAWFSHSPSPPRKRPSPAATIRSVCIDSPPSSRMEPSLGAPPRSSWFYLALALQTGSFFPAVENSPFFFSAGEDPLTVAQTLPWGGLNCA